MTRIWLILLPLALVAGAASLYMMIKEQSGRHIVAVAALVLGVAAMIGWSLDPGLTEEEPPSEIFVGAVPQVAGDGFASSSACRECHPRYHDSWHESFHRTMTQVVSPETVVAPFEGEVLESRGRAYRFSREGDEFFVDMVDPDWDAAVREQGLEGVVDAEPPRVKLKIVMSTGSHHYQTYWVNSALGNELRQVPWVYHIGEQRWLPAEDAFVSPPNSPRRLTVWNGVCIQCHAVHGQPGLDPESGRFVSQVSELGIACESCHGPGQEHIDFHREQGALSPDEQTATPDDEAAADESSDDGDPTIVNPIRLAHDKSSQVCGQCHSYFSFSDGEFWQSGFKYRAGDDLHATRMLHHYTQDHVQSRSDLKVGYWADGAMRIAGREFTAMDDSSCFKNGEMSCLSCHSMHDYETPDDQLQVGGRTGESCLSCHDSFRNDIEAHTHHPADSSGSNCLNCHMPHSSFGLLKATRSHKIDSPTARMTSEFGRPNACNLCHTDKPLEWTANHLADWYGQEVPELSDEDREVASSLALLLRGDAVQRAVVAWNLGSQPAREASGSSWQVPYLTFLMLDPYAGIRFTAYKSLREFPGFEDFKYDYLGTQEQRSSDVQQVMGRWRELNPEPDSIPAHVLMDPNGSMQIERVQALMKSRDDRPILLPE